MYWAHISYFVIVILAIMSVKLTYTCNPPSYKNASSYDHYKILLDAWSECTDVPKAKQGLAVALSLEGCENSLCEKLFNSVKIDDMKKEDGLTKVKTFLDSELGKDALEDSLSKFEDFDDYRKSPHESFNTYISNFDQKVCKMKKSGTELPSHVLAFTLLRRAGLSQEEKLLVISGVDYEQKDTLYAQTQKSLKKFKGEGSSCGGANASSFSQQPVIKAEPTFYTRGGYGYRGNNSRYPHSSGRGILRGHARSNMPFRQNTGGFFRNYGRNEGPNNGGSWRGHGANAKSWKPQLFTGSGEKPVNPLGTDGRPTRCDSCDSFRHWVKDCQHAHENARNGTKKVHFTQDNFSSMPAVNYTQETANYEENQFSHVDPYVYENPSEQLGAMGNYGVDMAEGMGNLRLDENYQYFPEQMQNEHVFHTAVLYTGGDEIESKMLQNEADQSCVLDSACTSTVCGYKWYQSYVDNLSVSDVDLIKSRKGEKTYKFGIGLAGSILEADIPAYIGGKRIMIRTDVVKADVPLLLSIGTMASLGMIIDLGNATATVFGQPKQLNRTSSGHLSLPLSNPSHTIERAFVVSLESAEPEVMKKRLLHIHKQFGHPTQDKFTELLKDCVKWKSEYGVALDEIYKNCDRCKEFARTPSRPVVAMPMAKTFNEKVCMDLKSWNGRWILHLVDMFSRYTISAFVPRKDSTAILCAIIDNWIAYFGIMHGIFSDNGGEFRNDELREVASVLNFSIQTTAADSPFQNGLCEKNHAIVDLILSKLKADYPHIKTETLLRWANMAKNSLQMWCGFSSNQLVFGFNPRLPSIMCDPLPSMNETTLSDTLCNTLNIIHDARKAFIQSEAENKIKIALRNRIRSSEAVYVKDDWVFYKRDGRQQWLGPARVIFQDRKVVLIDHGGFYIKVSPNRLTKVSNQFASEGESKVNDAGQGMFRMDVVDQPIQDRLPENEDAATQRADEATQRAENGQNMEVIQGAVNTEVENVGESSKSDDDGQEDFSGFSRREGTKAAKEFKAKYRESMNNNLPVENVRRSQRNIEKDANDVNIPAEVFVTLVPKEKWNCPESNAAKQEELNKLKEFKVYEEVPDVGQKTISTRFVLSVKNSSHRARLVARGFEEEKCMSSDSPTIGKCAIRLFLCISAALGWIVKTTDIKSAFLQGRELERDVFIRPPKEADVKPGHVWKLNRCLYGLNDAARQFYLSVNQALRNQDCIQSELDPSLFYYKNQNGMLDGILVSHIDDFLHGGSLEFDNHVMDSLRENFLAGKLEQKNFTYVGLEIDQDRTGITVTQNEYIDSLEMIEISSERAKKKTDLLSKSELTSYRSAVGSLNWVVQTTRPDVAFDMLVLSMKFQSGTVEDLLSLNKVIKKVKLKEGIVRFPCIGDPKEWKIFVFPDASFANLPDGVSSAMAYVVFLVGTGVCVLNWKSNKIVRVVKSTLAAETLALAEGIDDALYIKKMIHDLIPSIKLPIYAKTDNKDLVESIYSTKMVKDKRLRIELASIKEVIGNNLIEGVIWIESGLQLADCMTKQGASGERLLSILRSGSLDVAFSL